MTALTAYHNDPANKAAILAQLQAHHDADEIVKGVYWENGRGCAVGCAVHSDNHAEYETRFGIPQMLARLEDCIFEGLPNGKAKAWPIRFMSAIRPGADLSLVGWKFLHWILTDETVNPGINHPLVRDAVKQCAEVLAAMTKGQPAKKSAESASESARSAESAAWSAARSAAEAEARSAAESAESAESAARSAWAAARSAAARSAAAESAESAWAAAWAAARSAAARSARSARSAAESEAYIKMSDKLIDLLEAA